MAHTLRTLVLLILTVWLGAGHAFAGEASTEPAGPAPTGWWERPVHLSPFSPPRSQTVESAEGLRLDSPWSLHAYGGYLFSSRSEQSIELYHGTVGVSRELFGPVDFSLDFLGLLVRDEENWAGGMGFLPGLRLFIYRSRSWWVAFEAWIGVTFVEDPFPSRGTRFNFIEMGGPTLGFRLGQGHVILGMRYIHVSNAGVSAGPNDNPGISVVGICAGYEIRL